MRLKFQNKQKKCETIDSQAEKQIDLMYMSSITLVN